MFHDGTNVTCEMKVHLGTDSSPLKVIQPLSKYGNCQKILYPITFSPRLTYCTKEIIKVSKTMIHIFKNSHKNDNSTAISGYVYACEAEKSIHEMSLLNPLKVISFPK